MCSSFPTRDNAHFETGAAFSFMVEGRGLARGKALLTATRPPDARVRAAPVERSNLSKSQEVAPY